jgi:membrane protein DedA with SNARE-associated domain
LPFKIITISSGFVHFNILLFIIICFIARGLRFFAVAYLAYKYGAAIGPFLEKKGGQWTVMISGIIVLIALIFYFLFK